MTFSKILSNMSSIFPPIFTFYAVRLGDMWMCKWMREGRNADSSTPHIKLGFPNLAKRANAHHADKHTAIIEPCVGCLRDFGAKIQCTQGFVGQAPYIEGGCCTAM